MFLLTNCNNKKEPKVNKENTFVFTPHDTFVQDNFQELVTEKSCNFIKPDTSISKIKLRNIESAETILLDLDKIDEQECYHLYSIMESETLTLRQYPGDSKHQISIFKVEHSDKADYGYRVVNLETFKTEKGIKLGLTKKQIVEKLGNCYISKDSTKNYIELIYRIEKPNDSDTRILERQNVPSYFASYKLWNDKLKIFEFGFDYP